MSYSRIYNALASQFGPNEHYSSQVMAIAVAAKKMRRFKKGSELTIYVLDDNKNDRDDELHGFIAFLAKLKTQGINQRFQAVYFSHGHWVALDIKLQASNISFYIWDGANWISSLFALLNAIQHRFPDAKIRYTGDRIQHDLANCGTFALDAAFQLSKIVDLHEVLDEIIQDESEYVMQCRKENLQLIAQSSALTKAYEVSQLHSAINHLDAVSIDSFPPQFGPLLRHMQSLSMLVKDFYPYGYQGNSKIDLESYVKAHTRCLEGRSDLQNMSVVDKRIKIKTKAEAFFTTQTSLAIKVILDRRQGYIRSYPESLIYELTLYIKMRNQEDDYLSRWGKFAQLDGALKVQAAAKMVSLLKNETNIYFSRREIKALRDGELGKIIKSFELSHSLPEAFVRAEKGEERYLSL